MREKIKFQYNNLGKICSNMNELKWLMLVDIYSACKMQNWKDLCAALAHTSSQVDGINFQLREKSLEIYFQKVNELPLWNFHIFLFIIFVEKYLAIFSWEIVKMKLKLIGGAKAGNIHLRRALKYFERRKYSGWRKHLKVIKNEFMFESLRFFTLALNFILFFK